jgi:hypothetical protein
MYHGHQDSNSGVHEKEHPGGAIKSYAAIPQWRRAGRDFLNIVNYEL